MEPRIVLRAQRVCQLDKIDRWQGALNAPLELAQSSTSDNDEGRLEEVDQVDEHVTRVLGVNRLTHDGEVEVGSLDEEMWRHRSANREAHRRQARTDLENSSDLTSETLGESLALK